MDKGETFKSVMLAIATVYDKQITSEIAKMYWSALSFAKPEHLQQAMQDHLADESEGRWMPKPAHLIAHIRKYQQHDKRQAETAKQIESREEKKERDPQKMAAIMKELEELKRQL